MPSGAKVGASAVVGGLASAAGGGNFASGFLAAGVGSLAGNVPGLNTGNFAGNLVERAVLGGFASVLGGGKFANGAITAAFAYLAVEAVRDGGSTSTISGNGTSGGTSVPKEIQVIGDDTGNVDQAFNYLEKDPDAATLIDQAANAGGTIYVADFVLDRATLYADQTWVIHWDPYGSYVDPVTGNSITPALALYHEIGHVTEPYGANLFYNGIAVPDFDNEEEYRVITTIQNPAAQFLGEGIWESHHATCVPLGGPLERAAPGVSGTGSVCSP